MDVGKLYSRSRIQKGIWIWSQRWDVTKLKNSRIFRLTEEMMMKTSGLPSSPCLQSVNGSAVRKVSDSVTPQLFLCGAGTLSFCHHGNAAEDNTALSIAITQVSDWD